MKIKMYSKRNICIVPTYHCNADCPFCYARNFRKKFRRSMNWETFKKVADFLIKQGKDEISFLGGEPVIWPHIGKAVSYLKKAGIQVNFFTNGISHSQVPPDCVLINIYNGFDDDVRRRIRKTIHFYKSRGVEIGLRYNLFTVIAPSLKGDKRFLKDDSWFFDLAVSLADYVSISPAIPYAPSRELGNRIFKLVEDFHSRKKMVKISRAIPICLFNSGQFRYLREKCFLRMKCYSDKNIVVNPDGKTLFPCVNIPVFVKNIFGENRRTIEDDYRHFFDRLGKLYPFNRCKKCEYALDGRCQAGCLALRTERNIRAALEAATDKTYEIKKY